MQNRRPWGHFGVILVSFWCPWVSFGDPGRPRGPPKGAEAKKRRKREFADPLRDPFWGPLGDLGRHRADIFFVFGCRVGDLCDDRRFDGQNVLHKRSPRPPQTMKPKVSPTRKHCFHLSTYTSKMTENLLQWVPFWVPFRSFWAPWGRKSRKNRSQRGRWEVKNSMSKITSKKGAARRSETVRDSPGRGGECP